MKAFWNVVKILAALAAIAGAVYVAITYGDKIAAWVKEKISKYFPCSCGCCCDCDCDCECECVEDAPAEEVSAEEADFEG